MSATPVAIRTSIPLTPAFERTIRERLARAVGHMATLIERGSVRFEDVNGPRGGVDVECRVRLVMSGIPSVVASARGATPPKAFAAVLPKVKTGAQRTVDKRGVASPPAALEDSRTTPSRKSTRPGGPSRMRSGSGPAQRPRAASTKARAPRARSTTRPS